jgi:hypothetical protein
MSKRTSESVVKSLPGAGDENRTRVLSLRSRSKHKIPSNSQYSDLALIFSPSTPGSQVLRSTQDVKTSLPSYLALVRSK